jgi:ubiquinone/menaquinone biosynthesis C-methylase UbiE
VGNACSLAFQDHDFDLVLLLGPLYHLTDYKDRQSALAEAMRVLRPGGVVIGAAVTKFASLLHGYLANLIEDPVFKGIVARDLVDGQHRNPSNNPRYFTTTKFHEPTEFKSEFEAAGFLEVQTYSVESFTWMLGNLNGHLDRNTDELLDHLRQIESEPSIQGISSHILAVGQKPI